MITSASIETLKNDISFCCGNKEMLQEKFGDGVYLSQVGSLDKTFTHFQWIASELCEQGEMGLLVGKWFLKHQALLHEQNKDCLKQLCVNIICAFIGHLDNTSNQEGYSYQDLVKTLTEKPQKIFFDDFFSKTKIYSTLNRFTIEDDDGWNFFKDNTALFFGEALLKVDDSEIRDISVNYLIPRSSKKVLNIWLDHPFLGDKASKNLKDSFLSIIETWQEDCPDFLARLEKENILGGIFGAYMAKKGVSLHSSPKKM